MPHWTERLRSVARRRRRSRAGVEQRDRHLAPGERLVEHRQVADDHGEEAEADPRLDDGEDPAQGLDRRDVAVAQGEERDAGEIGIDAEARRLAVAAQRRAERPVQQREPHDQPEGPEPEQDQDRERPEQAEERSPPLLREEHAGRGGPGRPRVDVECPGEPVRALHATRQEHRLERVHQDEDDQHDARHRGDCHHRRALLDARGRIAAWGGRLRRRGRRRFAIRYATMPTLKSSAATLSRLLRRQIS